MNPITALSRTFSKLLTDFRGTISMPGLLYAVFRLASDFLNILFETARLPATCTKWDMGSGHWHMRSTPHSLSIQPISSAPVDTLPPLRNVHYRAHFLSMAPSGAVNPQIFQPSQCPKPKFPNSTAECAQDPVWRIYRSGINGSDGGSRVVFLFLHHRR